MAIFRALQAMALWITLWKLWMNARSHNPGRMGEACGYALHRSLTRCAMPLICLVLRHEKNEYGATDIRHAHNLSVLRGGWRAYTLPWEVGVWRDGFRAARGKEN